MRYSLTTSEKRRTKSTKNIDITLLPCFLLIRSLKYIQQNLVKWHKTQTKVQLLGPPRQTHSRKIFNMLKSLYFLRRPQNFAKYVFTLLLTGTT